MFCKVRKVGSTDLSILLQPLHIYIEVDQVALEGCGDVNFFGWMMVAILQETPIFHGKLHGFRMIPLNIFPTSTNSLINREQFPSQHPSLFFFKVIPVNRGLPWMQAGLDQCCSLCHDVLGELNGVEWS